MEEGQRHARTGFDPEARVRALSCPCVLVRKSPTARGRSHLGGRPPNCAGFRWPTRDGRPLTFLACIDLAVVRGVEWLPPDGILLFFYDTEKMPWGFLPEHRGGWEVIYLQDASAVDGDAPFPPTFRTPPELPLRPVELETASLPPSAACDFSEESLDEDDENALLDAVEAHRAATYGKGPRHQIGGYGGFLQEDPSNACHCVSRGITDPDDPHARRISGKPEDWGLLFQMDSDDDLEVMWGDMGMLYFMVPKKQARERDFRRTWLMLQCY